MAKNERTSQKAASAASKVLSNPKSSAVAKTAAASALTQVPSKKSTKNESTGKAAASAAGKVLSDPKSTKAAKTAAASALTQVADKPKNPKKKK